MTDDDYVPGSMDINEQARTYHRFLFLVRWAVVAHVVAGTTFVIAFCTSAGWMSALIVGAILLAIGVFVARRLDSDGPVAQAAAPLMTTVAENHDPIARQTGKAPHLTPVS
ncbi:aa3-type cytochrome c oxidase subunit IV [Phenylobacterium sp.]|uniref:aa3-type cytochrome c oxidase subunit IV n=1 Tax=Phenylobacterium sp. TaxID=1871053 RepID=UPI0019C92C34|nr:aa3-type cytochrome c oxidase subunit IV [Phenylobacterium sp.]MBC7168092.1 aa3-type cytochrome c oxidase subunit IV [Phenylobacterium sp.]